MIVPPATTQNKKVFGLGGGGEAQGPEKMNLEPRGPQILSESIGPRELGKTLQVPQIQGEKRALKKAH